MADRTARPMTEHGPGVTWLAGRAGCSPAELLADPSRLIDALADAGRAATGLALRLRSGDPAVRAEAEREAELLRRRFSDAPTAGERYRAKTLRALRDATARVRATRALMPDRAAGPSFHVFRRARLSLGKAVRVK